MQNSSSKWTHPRQWQQQAPVLRNTSARHLNSWLTEPNSLTARLQALAKAQGGRLQVRVLSEGWSLPSAEEAHTLMLRRGEFAWIREVILVGVGIVGTGSVTTDEPWVQARSVLPRRSLCGLNRRLTRLGSHSLGSLLFRDPALVRGPIYFARLPLLANTDTSQWLWARRSRFLLRGRAILVAEAFLPALLTASAHTDTITP